MHASQKLVVVTLRRTKPKLYLGSEQYKKFQQYQHSEQSQQSQIDNISNFDPLNNLKLNKSQN